MKRILSIDGGGIKGAVPAALLAHLEAATKKRVVEHFDLIVGTSTGGIIALALGTGYPAKDILSFYQTHGPRVFEQRPMNGPLSMFTPKYSPAGLRAALQSTFQTKTLGMSTTRLVIPAFNADRRNVRLFKTRHHPRFLSDHKEQLVDVALSTAAAPSYFPAHQLPVGGHIVDGGIWANNPVLVAVVEALTVLGWVAEEINLLSLGCTDDVFEMRKQGGKWNYKDDGVQMILHAQSQGAMAMAGLLLKDRPPLQTRLVRVAPQVSAGVYTLDDTSKISELVGLGEDLARNHTEAIASQFFRTPAEIFVPIDC
jgi:patatin-like phospholipase/acyl hydrolase